MKQKESNISIHPLRGYLPSYAILYVDELVKAFDVHFKVVPARKTKLGDCRYPIAVQSQIVITINQDLHPIQFLVTSLHELAHAKTFREYEGRAKAHGREWKQNFSQILRELCSRSEVPQKVSDVLISLARKPQASSYGHDSLQLLSRKENTPFLKEIPNGSFFTFNNKKFQKIKLLRTYVLCSSSDTNKQYKIHGLAQIEVLTPKF